MQTSDRWTEVSEILQRASTLAGSERAAYLTRACHGDAALQREVESLLSLDTNVLQRLDRPAFEMFDSPGAEETPPSFIGPYEIIGELGRGGSAEVVLARRTDGEDRRLVAIKILRPGLDSAEMAERLRQEGQILGPWRHPHIAEVYGGGQAAGRGPYLVMEYVAGTAIDDHCADHALSLRQRLLLFEKVCSAVQFAHQHLIVHRDLKPGNILVRSDGEPKLLDFGIAKIVDPLTPGRYSTTLPSRRRMTPRYASPEQVKGESIAAASDIYSLGVLLYELLTGISPYGPDEHPTSELLRKVCEQNPPAPSAAALQVAKNQDGSASPASNETRRLAKRLSGDLDNILLKALQKDPAARYGSVEQLKEDIRRHLDGHPVLAREATLRYRTAKLIRRRKRELALIAAAFLALLAFLGQREAQQREVTRQRDRAAQVTELLVALFEESDPETGRGRETPVGEILDRSVAAIDRLEGQDAVRAELLNTLGRIHRNLGLYDLGGDLLRQAVAVRETIHGPWHLEVAESLDELGDNYYESSAFEQAEAAFQQALEIRQQQLGEIHPLVATSLSHLGATYMQRGDLPAGETALRRVVEIRGQLSGATDPALASDLQNLANVLMSAGQLEESERLYRQSLTLAEAQAPPADLDLARMRSNLAEVLRQRGRDFGEAQQLMHQSVKSLRQRLGDAHPDVGAALLTLANILQTKNDLAAAEAAYREALQILESSLGADHVNIGAALVNLGPVLREQGALHEASSTLERALSILRSTLGPQHFYVAVGLLNLAMVEKDLGALVDAEARCRQGMALLRDSLGEEHPLIAEGLQNLGTVLAAQGRHAEAEQSFRAALALLRKLLGENHSLVAQTLHEFALVLHAQGNAEAEQLLRQALVIYRATVGRQNWRLATVESTLGSVLADQGRYEEARPLLRRSYQTLVTKLGPSNPATVAAKERLIAPDQPNGQANEVSPRE